MYINEFLKKQNFLVIAPHSDDEIIGCGGTIAKRKNLRGKVYVMVVSVGDLKHYAKDKKIVKKEERKKELQNALKFLKVDDFEICISDTKKYMRMDLIPQKELIEIFEEKARLSFNKIKPTIVAIPHPSYNQDHRAVFNAAISALRPTHPSQKHFVQFVLVYESLLVHWAGEFSPNFYVDISPYLQTKIKAFSYHKSQIAEFPHPTSIENLINLANMRGVEAGVKAAEAFKCYRCVI